MLLLLQSCRQIGGRIVYTSVPVYQELDDDDDIWLAVWMLWFRQFYD